MVPTARSADQDVGHLYPSGHPIAAATTAPGIVLARCPDCRAPRALAAATASRRDRAQSHRSERPLAVDPDGGFAGDRQRSSFHLPVDALAGPRTSHSLP